VYYEAQRTAPLAFMGQMVGLSALLSLVVSFIATLIAFQPIRALMASIEAPVALDNRMDQHRRFSEVETIKQAVHNARAASSRLEVALEERMEKLNNAQVRALQSQINPHFLHNTLEAIRWEAVALLGGENALSAMIEPLAQLMRVSLQCERYLVEVREEIEHVKLYLRIFDIRYAGRLTVRWAVQEEILSQRIVKLSIQPLVENAIHHGLRPKRYRGTLEISGIREGDQVVIRVQDDGIGIGAEEAAALNEHMETEYLFDDQYVGLRNVNQRCKLVYGERYGVHIDPARGEGFGVTLRFPGAFP
jgi:two-component system sensor histidine kinase YesM